MPRKYALPAVVMLAYAALMILAGIIAFFAAPETANPWTALIIPGVAGALMIVFGVMTLMAPGSRRVGSIGAHLGVVFTIIFTLLFGYTAFKRTGAMQRHPAAAAEYQQAVESGRLTGADEEARRAFFAERRAARHDIAYLVRTLWFLTALSGTTFVVLVVLRPKPGPAAPPPA